MRKWKTVQLEETTAVPQVITSGRRKMAINQLRKDDI